MAFMEGTEGRARVLVVFVVVPDSIVDSTLVRSGERGTSIDLSFESDGNCSGEAIFSTKVKRQNEGWTM